ncbi:hypothetical protein [Rhodopseudomonas palustris]|nr:hypothetical protein [Rhodopseudomonas palustris]
MTILEIVTREIAMTITELIGKHLRSAAQALKDRNFDDFAFAIRSIASFSEADKLGTQIAHSVAEVKLFSEWLRLNESDYTKYLDEVSVMFGKQRANGRLADVIHYLNDEKRRAAKLKEFESMGFVLMNPGVFKFKTQTSGTTDAGAAVKVTPDWKIDRTRCC